MTASKAIASSQPMLATLHPKLQQALKPGEIVIRAGRGKGMSLTVLEGLLLSVVVLAFGYWGVRTLKRALAADPLLQVGELVAVAPMLGFVGLLIWSAGQRYDGAHYALTNRRLLWRENRLLPIEIGWFVWSLSGDKSPPHTRIREITLMGSKTRGRIKLRDITWSSEPAVILTGVDHPLEFAELIKSTLGLTLPIQDHT